VDLVASTLQFKLDLYIQIDDQDEYTGELKKEWMYYDTLDCWAKGIVSNSTSIRANDRQIMDNRYKNDQFIEIRTMQKINMRSKITNIRNKQDIPVWTELDYPTETPTVFEVVGVTPIIDPFGVILAYNTTAKRSENQQIGI
jgi:hypothetical protein